MAIDSDSNALGMSHLDFLTIVDRSGLLSESRLEELRARVGGGTYPCDPPALAEQLVREGFLTEFQARRLLRGKVKGLVIGRYAVLDRIGSGAMGRVFKARHQLMDRVVALKVISAESSTKLRASSRFLREMKLVGQLDHINVIRAYDADLFNDVPYIVMEYLIGEDLRQLYRRRGSLPPGEVAEYMAQAARGLAHAHEKGVFHRDIKPSNLFLDASGVVKVLDLGLGSFAEDYGDEVRVLDTDEGLTVGTVDYVSPEQVAGGAVDGRTDLFSLGCTMYVLLSGVHAFPGETKAERLARRISGPHVPVTEFRPDLPDGLVAILDRLLAIRPERRFATATEAAEALEAWARREGQSPRARIVGGSSGLRPSAAVPAAEPPPPPIDWSLIEEALAPEPAGPRDAPPPREPDPPATPDRAQEHLLAHRRSLEEAGEESGREVQHHYTKEMRRLSRAPRRGPARVSEIDAPLVDRWVDYLEEMLAQYLSEPSPTHILVAILAIIAALGIAFFVVFN